jgi:hypothetical protein
MLAVSYVILSGGAGGGGVGSSRSSEEVGSASDFGWRNYEFSDQEKRVQNVQEPQPPN